jgi:prepilin-type N-terminal cleavage/methylation domain-containing protein
MLTGVLPPPAKRAFSLVELSIVLVILGLLIGGILSGQALIRAAELRSVTTEYQRYLTSVATFRDKYFAVPGDMTNATDFWGVSTSNGNGNGITDYAAGANVTGEMFQFWNHLALAGLLEGTYSGLAGPAGLGDHVLGANAPKSKLSNGGWGTIYYGSSGNVYMYTVDYGNALVFGASYTTDLPINRILKPEEQWNIDTKMDDGKPGTGKIVAREFVGWGNAGACTQSTSQTDYAGSYNLSNSAASCVIIATRVY